MQNFRLHPFVIPFTKMWLSRCELRDLGLIALSEMISAVLNSENFLRFVSLFHQKRFIMTPTSRMSGNLGLLRYRSPNFLGRP